MANVAETTTYPKELESTLSQLLYDLIVAKYSPKAEFKKKLDVFLTFNEITLEEYQCLMVLLNSTFADTKVDSTSSTTTTDKPVDNSTDTKTTN